MSTFMMIGYGNSLLLRSTFIHNGVRANKLKSSILYLILIGILEVTYQRKQMALKFSRMYRILKKT